MFTFPSYKHSFLFSAHSEDFTPIILYNLRPPCGHHSLPRLES